MGIPCTFDAINAWCTFARLSSELESGEFGVVWSVGTEEREVAVKSLADGSTEEKRIQFLQEAANMGQFKHPNVITLHGVLLDQEPVIIIIIIHTFEVVALFIIR